MTEEERIKAVGHLFTLVKADRFAASVCAAVCRNWNQPDVGHLARHAPDSFDELYEEVVALIREV